MSTMPWDVRFLLFFLEKTQSQERHAEEMSAGSEWDVLKGTMLINRINVMQRLRCKACKRTLKRSMSRVSAVCSLLKHVALAALRSFWQSIPAGEEEMDSKVLLMHVDTVQRAMTEAKYKQL